MKMENKNSEETNIDVGKSNESNADIFNWVKRGVFSRGGCFLGCFHVAFVTFLCGLSQFQEGCLFTSMGIQLPYLASYLQVSLSTIAIIYLSRSFGGVVGSLVIGWVCDRAMKPEIKCLSLDLHKLFFLVVALVMIGLLVNGLIPWVPILCVFQFFGGMGSFSVFVLCPVIVHLLMNRKLAAVSLQAFNLCLGTGGVVFPLLCSLLFINEELEDRVYVLVINGMVCVFGMIPLLIILVPFRVFINHHEEEKEDNETKIESETTEESEKTGKKVDEPHCDEHKNSVINQKKGLCKSISTVMKGFSIIRFIFVVSGGLCDFFYLAFEGSFSQMYFLYCLKMGLNPREASMASSSFYFSYTIGNILGIFEAFLTNPVFIAFKNTTMTLVVPIVFTIFFSDSRTGIWFLSTILGFFCSSTYPNFFAIPGHFGITLTGTESAIIVSVGAAGIALPNLVLILMNELGREWFLYLIVIFGASLFFFWYIQYSFGLIIAHRSRMKEREKKVRE